MKQKDLQVRSCTQNSLVEANYPARNSSWSKGLGTAQASAPKMYNIGEREGEPATWYTVYGHLTTRHESPMTGGHNEVQT
jgi:hypothetical protein